jgi:hypothetical protein
MLWALCLLSVLLFLFLWGLLMNLKDSLNQRIAAIQAAATSLATRVTALEANSLTSADRTAIETGLDSVVTQLNAIAP